MNMKKGDLIFVYGTLRSGERADISHDGGVSYVSDDIIAGRIYNVGSFPGVKLEAEEGDVVYGEIYHIDDERVPAWLDMYEGYPDHYDRTLVETAGGFTVWVYVYQPTVFDSMRIESGDWKERQTNVCRLNMESRS